MFYFLLLSLFLFRSLRHAFASVYSGIFSLTRGDLSKETSRLSKWRWPTTCRIATTLAMMVKISMSICAFGSRVSWASALPYLVSSSTLWPLLYYRTVTWSIASIWCKIQLDTLAGIKISYVFSSWCRFRLIALSFIDSGYLFASILESFRKSFDMATEIHKVLFPKVLYPFHSIMLTMSIFMTVGISLERYTAVHQPVDYNQVCIYREILWNPDL